MLDAMCEYVVDVLQFSHLVVHELQGESRLPYASTTHHDHLVEGQGTLVLALIGSHYWTLFSPSLARCHTPTHTHAFLYAQTLTGTTCGDESRRQSKKADPHRDAHLFISLNDVVAVFPGDPAGCKAVKKPHSA